MTLYLVPEGGENEYYNPFTNSLMQFHNDLCQILNDFLFVLNIKIKRCNDIKDLE